MLVTARNYQIDPNYSWQILGYGSLTPRQSRRLVRACNDLWARDAALDELDRARGDGSHKWNPETVLLIKDTHETAARYGVDVGSGALFGDSADSVEVQ